MRFAITLLIVCVASLLSLGMVMLYSAKMTESGAHYLVMQLTWGALGLVLCLTAASMDYAWFKRLAWPMFGLSLVLLALVLVPHIGLKINGARRWLGYGGIRFQPSEFAKLALIVILAWYVEQHQRRMDTWKRGIVLPGLLIGVTLGLIFIEPDRGTTILLAAVSGVMLLLAGVRWRFVLPPALLAAGGLAFSLWHDPMRMKRIFSWLDLEEHKRGVGYQAYQAMLALGSGGWDGLGLGSGRQKLGFIPERHTDFIFAVIGEELGLIATLFVLVAFVVLFFCGITIAKHARDTFGMMLGAGISFLIGFQALINIGVVTSALPNKGLPLPFVSYGGSSLMMMLLCVGILLSIARYARVPEHEPHSGETDLPAPSHAK